MTSVRTLSSLLAPVAVVDTIDRCLGAYRTGPLVCAETAASQNPARSFRQEISRPARCLFRTQLVFRHRAVDRVLLRDVYARVLMTGASG